MKTAVIIGASSGIGAALADVLSANGYRLGLTGRRLPMLEQVKARLPNEALVQQMDVTDVSRAETQFLELVQQLGRVDLVIISAGVGHLNPDLDVGLEMETIQTNVNGFTVLSTAAFKHFTEQGRGHLVGLSSIAALRGGAAAPAYNASKAYISNYLEALRVRAAKQGLDIAVTDIRPGFVDTDMAQGEGLFWVASPETAAAQIYRAIQTKQRCAYVTKRWRLIAWILQMAPGWLYNRL
ncbi:MAG: SDR family NAD(P)-dependent oxidoreductase [Rhodobacteraceae bacterium]|nr:SDR family NAD(P)-dependent oxidoreductase [Paracoccaceae bacterium]